MHILHCHFVLAYHRNHGLRLELFIVLHLVIYILLKLTVKSQNMLDKPVNLKLVLCVVFVYRELLKFTQTENTLVNLCVEIKQLYLCIRCL